MGKGENIVFLHGWGGSTDSFLAIANILKNKYRCILIDFAGFGKTPEPDRVYRLRDFTDDLDALLDELDIKRCFFVAHSFGGRVAIDYVTSKSRNIDGLILTDIAGLKPRRGVKYHFNVLGYKIYKKLGRDVSNMGSSDYRALSGTMKGTFVNIVNEYLNEKMNNIHIPTILIWGDKDKDTPMYMARYLRRHIKDSALIVFEGRGHFAYIEEPFRFASIVDAFIGGT